MRQEYVCAADCYRCRCRCSVRPNNRLNDPIGRTKHVITINNYLLKSLIHPSSRRLWLDQVEALHSVPHRGWWHVNYMIIVFDVEVDAGHAEWFRRPNIIIFTLVSCKRHNGVLHGCRSARAQWMVSICYIRQLNKCLFSESHRCTDDGDESEMYGKF